MSASRYSVDQIKKSDLKKKKYHWYQGDCLDLIDALPDESIQLIVTSPPYGIKKEYEKSSTLADAISFQEEVIEECFRILSPTGSMCWQVGNYVEGEGGERVPWDILLYKSFRRLGLKLRSRIIWTYEHGMHARHFFSGRYETIMWFTKSDDYFFNLDAVRVPQKQPTKRFYKGPRKGELSCHPLGKNPGDVWNITNVKNGHPEKIPGGHPCQFPTKLVDRLVKSMTKRGDIVFDPFGGTASTLVSALQLGRIGVGAELEKSYYKIGQQRLKKAEKIGILPSPKIITSLDNTL
jgi:adenine-specific DNA-methyltransferase